MDTETVRCAGVVRASGRRWIGGRKPCSNSGTLEHEGRLWCKTHHPSTCEAKRKARDAKWERKWVAEKREYAQKSRDAADIVKFRALARRAAELGERREIADNLNADQILDDLAALHPEAP